MTLREHLLSAPDAGKMLGLSTVRINVLLNQGRFEGAEKIGRNWVIPREAVENFQRLKPGVKSKTKQQHRDDAELVARALAENERGRG
ncbi:MAG: helix-turn-helix domain-containing protein [Synergistaceae bacterium]|nr:helix-turn-helix domain-containing protein [Synergistaceae bacterium]